MIRKSRGRPKLKLAKQDSGTPELRRKKISASTTEIVDILLQKKLFSEPQHKAALHFRWLYTIKYGIKNVTSSYEPRTNIAASSADSEWRNLREAEYNNALKLLEGLKCHKTLLDISIFNQQPSFLRLPRHLLSVNRHYLMLIRGLDLLASEWKNRLAI